MKRVSVRVYLTALMAVFLLAAAVRADVISVDPDGGGALPPIAVATFDYQPGNGVFVGLSTANSPMANHPFTYLYQARLANFLDSSSNVIPVTGLNQANGFEITAIFAFSGVANGNGGLTAYTLAAAPSYFRLFYDANPLTQANDLTGTGFDDGTNILAGSITQADGSYSVTPTAPLPLFDGFGGDNYAGLTSLVTTGGSDLTVGGISVDSSFFLTPLIQFHLVNSSNISPFAQVDPSQKFQPNFANLTPILGAANGLGPDFQVQSDATGSFTVVPEPASLTLMVLGGLGCLTYARRRRVVG